MEICFFASAFLRFEPSHENIMIRAVSVVCCVSQRFLFFLFFLYVPRLDSFHPQKVWDNYGSKKTLYQSRLTTSHQAEPCTPFYLLKRSGREDELRNSHLGDPADFPTRLLSVSACLGRLLVLCYLMCAFEAAMQAGQRGCCSHLLPLCRVPPGGTGFKAWQSRTFPGSTFNTFSNHSAMVLGSFLLTCLFYHSSEGPSFH